MLIPAKHVFHQFICRFRHFILVVFFNIFLCKTLTDFINKLEFRYSKCTSSCWKLTNCSSSLDKPEGCKSDHNLQASMLHCVLRYLGRFPPQVLGASRAPLQSWAAAARARAGVGARCLRAPHPPSPVIAVSVGLRHRTSRKVGSPREVRSVRRFSRNRPNPHIGGIFLRGANPTHLNCIQTAMGMGPTQPSSLQPPTKHTVSSALLLMSKYLKVWQACRGHLVPKSLGICDDWDYIGDEQRMMIRWRFFCPS